KIEDLQKALIALADRSRNVVMPSFTHLQRAQPIVGGAEALAWCFLFWRDTSRLIATGEKEMRWESPLGSGAIAGTSLPIDANQTASLLGFAVAPESSIALTASR